MSSLQLLHPLNIEEEKTKFLQDQTYNPQLVYDQPIPDDYLAAQGTIQPELLSLAQQIVEEVHAQWSEQALVQSEGAELTQAEVEEKIKHFLAMHHLEHRFELVWSVSFLARTSINADTIKLRLPVSFRQEGLLGMLYHEIGTHALRRINYEQQPWFKRKKKYGFAEYLPTEEGLAVLHSLLPKTNQYAYSAALKYLGVAYAQQHSFVELWQFLTPYISDFDKRWQACLRQKRGLTDTSQPGGFTKDLVYFAGAHQVWQWLSQHDFDPTLLYYGKLAWSDVDKARELNPNYEPILPSFLVTNPQTYASQLLRIGQLNHFV